VPPAPDAAPPKTASQGVPSPLEAQLGGRAQLEKLSAQLLDHDEAAMTRVYALRRLAEQFPAEAEKQMSVDNQELLQDLARQHVAALALEAGNIEGLTSTLLAAHGAAPLAAASWQAGVQSLFVSARQVETLLPAWLGATAPDRDSRDVPQQLATALAQLRADVQQCERLLKL
jgi:hypothetical protein